MVVVLMVVAVIGTYTFLPAVFGGLLARNIQGQMDLQAAPDVSVESEPPPSMLAGEFAQGQISLQDADFGDIRPREVTIDLEPFDLDVTKTMRSGELSSEQPLSGTLRMEVSEKEVTRIAAEATEAVRVENVDLEKDRATVETAARVLGFEVPVSVRGGLGIAGQNLVFRPESVAAFGVDLPERVSEELISQTDFSYPIRDLPYDAEVDEIQIEEDYLVILGRLESIPLGESNG